MRIIVGLGNPSTAYENTRHNAGFMVVDALAPALGTTAFLWKKNCNAEVCDLQSQEAKLVLVKPQTYMNRSGASVRALMDFYKLLPKTLGLFTAKDADLSAFLTVVHDDIDLPLGTFKIQKNRSAAGHNGVQSIIEHLKTKNFTRVRVGIATPLARVRIPVERFVLAPFSKQEREMLHNIIPEIVKKIAPEVLLTIRDTFTTDVQGGKTHARTSPIGK